MTGGPARVLEALRSTGGGPCSGEVLSEELQVSRAQIWKHVEALRKLGYQIEGAPGGGYRLAGVPDRLYPEEIQAGLETRWLGRSIEYFEEIDSTNRVAAERAREGAAAGTCIVAECQTAGRGRLGRSFFSPFGLNLYTSIVLRPDIPITRAPELILASAVATAEAVADTLGEGGDERVEIKWPNDVLIDGRKTSGILVELAAEATRVESAVLGIGVNLNVERASFPSEFRHLATSLRSAVGHPVDRVAFTRRLYCILEDVLDLHAHGGFQALRPRFEARFRMPGRRVRVIEGASTGTGHELEGVVRGLAADGSLEVEDESGRVRTVIAGDVTLAKEDAAP
jgi:BirA family biotin operon repressor/biotin-[acetyl-CoA-carboxylase] ligase